MSRGAIIAIALVAALCAVILVGALIYLLMRRRVCAAHERRRRTEESFRPRMRSIVLPSERSMVMEERYPWMRDGNVTLGQLSREELPRDSEPYDPYTQRRAIPRPLLSSKPPELVPMPEDLDDDVIDVVPRTQQELESLRPHVTSIRPPSDSDPTSRPTRGR